MPPIRPTFVDLFCGAGGFTTGLKAAGLHHVVGIDSDRSACETYARNHGHVICSDIKNVKAADVRALTPGGRVDIVAASPPCQSYSLVGPRSTNDPKDWLFLDALRLADELGASAVVMENVVGMLSKRDPDGTPFVDRIRAEFEARGFQVHTEVVMATDFGVPQTRRRVIFLASRRRVCAAPPSLSRPPPAVQDAAAQDLRVGPLLQPSEEVQDPFYWMTDRKAAYYRNRARTRGHVGFVDPNAPARTLRAGYMKSRGAEALVESADGRLRMLTELECARIQTFPDTYQFLGSRSSVYRQIGNAIPPRLAAAVGRSIMACLNALNVPKRAPRRRAAL